MKKSMLLIENEQLQLLAGAFPRSPRQLNRLLEGDAELLQLDNGSVLAITTDSIVEEITTGLYTDPRHIGWMTVTVNLSDLAAVGAEPLGLLLSHSLPAGFPDTKLKALQQGVADACTTMQVFVLGGDTNQSPHWQMGGTAVGLIRSGPVITRKGTQPGDALYISGQMGAGNAFAFEILLKQQSTLTYRPVARLKEGQIIRPFGSACIDTSDGLFPALCNLMEINATGVELNRPFADLVHPTVATVARENKLPEWFFLAGPHGEFELVFTIPVKHETAFLSEANKINWHPLKIGSITANAGTCTLARSPNQKTAIDAFQIANLFTASGSDPERYLASLFKINIS